MTEIDMDEMGFYVALFIITFLFSLFMTWQIFRFYVKLFAHYWVITMAALLPIPFAIFRPNNVKNTDMCSFVALQLTKMFQISVEIRGEEHLKDESAIVVCNHQSSIDVTSMMAVWPKMPKCAPIIKKELLYAGPFGICAWLCGSVFVDRSNSARAQTSLNRALNYLTERKIKLWFFPEGTRNDSGTMLPFKKGAFHLAIQSQRPILPMTFSSYASFYNKRIYKFDNGGKVIIQILPPISTEGLTVDDMSTLMANVRSQMEASIASSTKEVEAAAVEAKKSK